MSQQSKGLTLIEVIITVFLVSILLGSLWVVYQAGFKTVDLQLGRSGAKAALSRTIVNISHELRQATSLTSAQATSFTFIADLDDSGQDETIQYSWLGAAGNPLNRVSTVTQPVINSVNALSFSYYDSNNNLLSFPVTASQVRLVAIDITAVDKEETFQLRSKIRLRNL